MNAPLSQLLSSPKLWRSESAASGAASGAEGEAPCYVFDAAVLRRRSELAEKALPLTRAFMKEHCSHVRQPQFGVGFRGAGAPMHTHHAALNASLAGRKRWFLMPPEVAGWTLDPVAGWEGSEDFERKRKAGLWEVTQEAGDLLFVPEGWGHATILDSYAVGVAQEFVPWSSVNGGWAIRTRGPAGLKCSLSQVGNSAEALERQEPELEVHVEAGGQARDLFRQFDVRGAGELSWRKGEVMSCLRELLASRQIPLPELPLTSFASIFMEVKAEAPSTDGDSCDLAEMCLFVQKVSELVTAEESSHRQPSQSMRGAYFAANRSGRFPPTDEEDLDPAAMEVDEFGHTRHVLEPLSEE
ncbi:unnamed protein product [Effrenium voratum]|nr:unnamed protein product [Effrenium voratum]